MNPSEVRCYSSDERFKILEISFLITKYKKISFNQVDSSLLSEIKNHQILGDAEKKDYF